MQYFVYILFSSISNRFYIGQTSNIDDRLKRHNEAREKSTAPHVPWVLIWRTAKSSRSEAIILERKLKNLSPKRLISFIQKYSQRAPTIPHTECRGADRHCLVGIPARSQKRNSTLNRWVFFMHYHFFPMSSEGDVGKTNTYPGFFVGENTNKGGKIQSACKFLDIKLLDHIIVVPQESYLNFVYEGLLQYGQWESRFSLFYVNKKRIFYYIW